MGACEQWTRVTVLSIEGLIILNDVATIALGARVGLIGLAIAVAVTVLLLTAPARACFAGR
jgi:O-antigen/teichoic acid export membrane protein